MRKRNQGQAIVEYILILVMVTFTIAVVIRNTNQTIYRIWTGLARQIAKPSSESNSKAAPDF